MFSLGYIAYDKAFFIFLFLSIYTHLSLTTLNLAGRSCGDALDFYSGDAWFESQAEHQQTWLRFFVVFSVPPGKYQDNTSIKP
jgi:hypothetical protein